MHGTLRWRFSEKAQIQVWRRGLCSDLGNNSDAAPCLQAVCSWRFHHVSLSHFYPKDEKKISGGCCNGGFESFNGKKKRSEEQQDLKAVREMSLEEPERES